MWMKKEKKKFFVISTDPFSFSSSSSPHSSHRWWSLDLQNAICQIFLLFNSLTSWLFSFHINFARYDRFNVINIRTHGNGKGECAQSIDTDSLRFFPHSVRTIEFEVGNYWFLLLFSEVNLLLYSMTDSSGELCFWIS